MWFRWRVIFCYDRIFVFFGWIVVVFICFIVVVRMSIRGIFLCSEIVVIMLMLI